MRLTRLSASLALIGVGALITILGATGGFNLIVTLVGVGVFVVGGYAFIKLSSK